jgi:hypothetical protein
MNRPSESTPTGETPMNRRQVIRLLGASVLACGAVLAGVNCKSEQQEAARTESAPEAPAAPSEVDRARAQASADCYSAVEANEATDPLAFQRCSNLTPEKERIFGLAKAEFERMNTGGTLKSGYVFTPDSGAEFDGSTGLRAFKKRDIRGQNGLNKVNYVVSIRYTTGKENKDLVMAVEGDGTVVAVTHI